MATVRCSQAEGMISIGLTHTKKVSITTWSRPQVQGCCSLLSFLLLFLRIDLLVEIARHMVQGMNCPDDTGSGVAIISSNILYSRKL